jgi:outer membrane receptor for monomeric catechols
MNHNGDQFAGIADVKAAYADDKITMEEAHDLNPGIAKEKNSQGYETHKLRAEGTLTGNMQRSEGVARRAHKKAGLKSEGNW